MNGVQPNFGTFPHMLVGTSRATESWWVGLNDREAFTARVQQEQARMASSRIGQWTVVRIVDMELPCSRS